MKQDKVLQVCYEDQTVGTLAMTADHKVAFQYSDEWLETGFSINPFSLPLQKQVFVPVKDHFEGLFGVFAVYRHAGCRIHLVLSLCPYGCSLLLRTYQRQGVEDRVALS